MEVIENKRKTFIYKLTNFSPRQKIRNCSYFISKLHRTITLQDLTGNCSLLCYKKWTFASITHHLDNYPWCEMKIYGTHPTTRMKTKRTANISESKMTNHSTSYGESDVTIFCWDILKHRKEPIYDVIHQVIRLENIADSIQTTLQSLTRQVKELNLIFFLL